MSKGRGKRMTTITVSQKKEFMKYLLNNYTLQRRESVWILNYLMAHDSLIEKVHFVEDAMYTPRALILATRCSDKPAFKFYKSHLVTTDADKAFHDIRLNRDEDIYIEVFFKSRHASMQWFEVLEENAYYEAELKEKGIPGDKKIATNLLQNVEYNYKMSILDRLIDQALELGNKDAFMMFTEQRNMLMITKPPTAYETVKR
jgi:uncharacterized protein YpiB (UPF0302 family)